MTTTESPRTANVNGTESTYIGHRRVRREDPALLTGEARFTDDLAIPGALHMAVLRSTMAHARLVSVDVSEALRRCPASWPCAPATTSWTCGRSRCRVRGPSPRTCATRRTTRSRRAPSTTSATASRSCSPSRTPRQAHDALEAIVVDYDPLPTVVDLEEALADGVLVHEELGTNSSYTWELKIGEDAVERAFAEAPHVVKEHYVDRALIPMAMEPRAVAAGPDLGGDVTLYSTTQIPHILKDHAGDDAGDARAPDPGRRPVVSARARLQARRLRRGAALRGALAEAPAPRPVGRGAERDRAGHHPGPRSDPGDRAGRRRRRQAPRRPGEPHRRHGRLPNSSPRASRSSQAFLYAGVSTCPRRTRSPAPGCSRR